LFAFCKSFPEGSQIDVMWHWRGAAVPLKNRVQGFCTENLILFFSIQRSRVLKIQSQPIAACHELIIAPQKLFVVQFPFQ
jgi:hypothetical protein